MAAATSRFLLKTQTPSPFTASSKQRRAQMMCFSLPVGGGETSSVTIEANNVDQGTDFGLLLLARVPKRTPKRPKLNIQAFVEEGILNCRFFTLLAVGGTLLGSVRCFVEGCLLILESYSHYLHELPQASQHFLPRLIEATDMFLLGTAMLTFGNALRFMFMGQQDLRDDGSHTLPRQWNGVRSAIQAKLKIGHAIVMILQVQMLEKFKSVPVANGLDFALLAASLFLSSASMFILSRMAAARSEEGKSEGRGYL